MFQSEYLNKEGFLVLLQNLKVILRFAIGSLMSGVPIIAYMYYPLVYQPYEYFSSTFWVWIFSGFLCIFITMFLYPIKSKFRRDHDWAFGFHCLLLILFWASSFFFFSVTDSTYNRGGQLKLEQAGRCDLVHEDEQNICKARQHLLTEKNGVFKLISGNVLGDKTCVSVLQEVLSSGMLRNNNLHADANFCEKLKVGDGVKLSSYLIKSGDTCNGFRIREEFILITESKKQMRIDVCTTYELIPS